MEMDFAKFLVFYGSEGCKKILYFDFTIDYAQELDFRRANGDYLRERQWKDLIVEVYII